MTDTAIDLPIYNTPIIDARGSINEVWWRFFATLLARTGGTAGDDIEALRELVELIGRRLVALDSLDASMVPVEQKTSALPAELSVPTLINAVEAQALEMVTSHGLQYDPELHALVTSASHGFMAAPDKAKLDALSVPITPVNIVAAVSAANTTADTAVVALTVAANGLPLASAFDLKLNLTMASAASAGTLSLWLKLGSTKILTLTFTLPAVVVTNREVSFRGTLTIRTLGAAGTLKVVAEAQSDGNVLNAGPIILGGNSAIDTTTSNTFTLGVNWSVANAANTLSAHTASIIQEK